MGTPHSTGCNNCLHMNGVYSSGHSVYPSFLDCPCFVQCLHCLLLSQRRASSIGEAFYERGGPILAEHRDASCCMCRHGEHCSNVTATSTAIAAPHRYIRTCRSLSMTLRHDFIFFSACCILSKVKQLLSIYAGDSTIKVRKASTSGTEFYHVFLLFLLSSFSFKPELTGKQYVLLSTWLKVSSSHADAGVAAEALAALQGGRSDGAPPAVGASPNAPGVRLPGMGRGSSLYRGVSRVRLHVLHYVL